MIYHTRNPNARPPEWGAVTRHLLDVVVRRSFTVTSLLFELFESLFFKTLTSFSGVPLFLCCGY